MKWLETLLIACTIIVCLGGVYAAARAGNIYASNLYIGTNSTTSATLIRPLVSTENATYTVGAGKNYATVQAAINALPYYIYHNIRIVIDNGNYDEHLTIPAIIIAGTNSDTEGSSGALIIESAGQTKNSATVNSISIVGTIGANDPVIRYLKIDSIAPTSDENCSVCIYHSNQVYIDSLNITGNSKYAIMAYSSSIYTRNVSYNNQNYGVLLKRNSHTTHGDVNSVGDYGTLKDAYILANSGYAEIVNEYTTAPNGTINCGFKGGFAIDGRNNTLYCIDRINSGGAPTTASLAIKNTASRPDIWINHTSNSAAVQYYTGAGTATAVTFEHQNTDGNVWLIRNNANHADATNHVVMVVQEHASSIGGALYVRQDGPGAAITVYGGSCVAGRGAYLYNSGKNLYACNNDGNATRLSI